MLSSQPKRANYVSKSVWIFSRHWKPDASYFRRDWTLKPTGQVWKDLVKKQWWTSTSGLTDANGEFQTRGFLGDYEITVEHVGKSTVVPAKLNSKDGEMIQVNLQ